MRTDSPTPPEANPPVRRGPMPDGTVAFVKASVVMGWRWLTRMRTALYLLGVLALLTLLATIVPQEPNVPSTVADWRLGEAGPGRFVAGLVDAVGGFDVYGSPIFLALLLLLFLSLTACLIPRYRALWRVWRHSRPPRTRYLGSQEETASFATAASPAEVHERARALLGGRRWRLRSEVSGADGPGAGTVDDDQVAAEKGLLSREGGSLVFHTSFYLLLIGVVAGQLLGFSGQVGVVEGEGFTDTATSYWSYDPGRLWGTGDHRGFLLELDEFRVDWHRDPELGGQPKLFASDVTVTHADGTTTTDTVAGNDPLVLGGMRIHQLDWGYAPRVQIRHEGEVVHDGYLPLLSNDSGFWRGAAKAPAAEPGVGLKLTFWAYAPEGEDGNPVPTGAPWADAPLLFFEEYRGDLRLSRSQNVNELDETALELNDVGALRQGGETTLPDGVTVEFVDLRRWVGFQVSSKPTIPLLLVAGMLVLAGLIPALYAYRRRLWVRAEPDDGGGSTLVTVAGRAFQRQDAFEDEFRGIVDDLRAGLGGEPDDGADHGGRPPHPASAPAPDRDVPDPVRAP